MQQASFLSRLRRCGTPAVPRELIVADVFNAHRRCHAKPRQAEAAVGECYNHLLLNSRAASPLRAYAILNYTLGVGQTKLRGVGFAAIRFCH